jgi:transposase InsO family protein
VLQRQLGDQRIRFQPDDRALLAALLHPLPRPALQHIRLLVHPDTILRWHRDLLARRHPPSATRPTTNASLDPRPGAAVGPGEQQLGIPRGARRTAHPRNQDRRLHGLGDPARGRRRPSPDRTTTTWATFRRSQAHAPLAADFIETVTLTGARLSVLAVIEHATRRIRVLGATAHPTTAWVTQAARDLAMDLHDTGSSARYLIRDRDAKYPALFDAILADSGIEVVRSGVQIPRMNAIMERWVRTCRRELLDRTLIYNQRHLLHALREYETFYNAHRPHQGIANAPGLSRERCFRRFC